MTEQSVWIVYKVGGVVVGVCASDDGAQKLAKDSRKDGDVEGDWRLPIDVEPTHLLGAEGSFHD